MRNTTLLFFASITLLVACSCRSQHDTASARKARPSTKYPTADQPFGEQPMAAQPTGDQPADEQAKGESPTAQAPAADQPTVDQAKPEPGDQASADKPDAGQPDAGQPNTAKPDAPKPDAATADADKPDADKPDTVTVIEKADADKPDVTTADAVKPDEAKPDVDTDKPDASKADADKPGVAKADAEKTGTDADNNNKNDADKGPAADAPVASRPLSRKTVTDRPANENPAAPREQAFGSIERLDPALDDLIAPGTKVEKLAEGLDWAEGPVWQRNGGYLLFSDVPQNVIFKWDPNDGKVTQFLKPSGYTGSTPRGGEPGSNGLTFDHEGRLVVCQHGDRRIVRVERDGKWTTLADKFDGKRLNSPNDLCFDKSDNLYFTDPSYGLEGKNDDPKKELAFNGVYLLRKDGRLVLLTKGMTFPNGIALSPDEKTLYVNQSDPKQPIIRSFSVKEDGTLANAKILFDASHLTQGRKGLPDGLKVDEKGNLFSTGPGGVLVISPEGKHLGTINTGEATGNCNWGGDGSDLYITADMYICRVKTKTHGNIP